MSKDNIVNATRLVDEIADKFKKQEQAIADNVKKLQLLNKEYAKVPSDYILNQQKIQIAEKELALSKDVLKQKQKELSSVLIDGSEKEVLAARKSVIIAEKRIKTVEGGINRNIRAIERLDKAQEKELTNSIKLNRAYNKLNAKYVIASNNLQDLVARGRKAGQTQKEYNKELRDAERIFDALNKRIIKADNAVKKYNRNVGNYPKGGFGGILASVGSLGTAVGGLAGAGFLLKEFGTEVFETTKELQSLDLALRNVSETDEQFGRNKLFLKKITEAYGIEIKGLTKQFTQFYVSAKDKISGAEIEQIFESVSKSAANMGLSVDAQNRAFIALNQMMSKGTIQSEELKGQLGEALPGAFKIMADSIGVTEKELNDLLKQGKVMASDVLPKFAEQLEKAYGIENVKRVDNLASSQARLSNKFTEFIDEMNKGGIVSKSFMFVIDSITNIFDLYIKVLKDADAQSARFKKGIQDLLKPFSGLGKKVGFLVNKFPLLKKAIVLATTALNNFFGFLKSYFTPLLAFVKIVGFVGKIFSGIGFAVEALQVKLTNLFKKLEPFTKIKFTTNPKELISSISKALEESKGVMVKQGEGVAEAFKRGFRSRIGDLETSVIIQEQKAIGYDTVSNEVKQEAEQTGKSEASIVKDKKAFYGQEFIDEATVELRELNKEYEYFNEQGEIDTADKIAVKMTELAEQIGYAKGELEALNSFREKVKVNTTSGKGGKTVTREKNIKEVSSISSFKREGEQTDTSAFSDLNTVAGAVTIEETPLHLKPMIDLATENLTKFYADWQEQREKNLKAEQDANDHIKELSNGLKDTLIDSIGVFLNLEVEKYERLRTENEEYYDALIANASEESGQKKLLEKQKQKEDEKLKKKQQKAELKAFLFKQSLALADVGIKLAQTLSAISLQSKVLPPGASEAYQATSMALAITNAAAQTGAILATTIPKFMDGHLSGTHEGLAMINDGGRTDYIEILERKNGGLEIFEGRDQIVKMNLGDKVHKASDKTEFLKNKFQDHNYDSLLTTLNSSLIKFSSDKVKDMFTLQIQSIKNDVVKGVEKGLSKFNNINNNTVIVDDSHNNWLRSKGY